MSIPRRSTLSCFLFVTAFGALSCDIAGTHASPGTADSEPMERKPSFGIESDSASESSETPALRASGRLRSCVYKHAQLDAGVLIAGVACPGSTHIVSGGCSIDHGHAHNGTQGRLLSSYPYEFNTGNVPDDNDMQNAVGDPNGWACKRSDPDGILIVSALCCRS